MYGNNTHLLFQSSVVRTPGGFDWVLRSGSYNAQIKVMARLGFYLEAWGCGGAGERIHFQAHSGGWQNPVPYSCRFGDPISLLAVSVSSPCSENCLHPICVSLHLQISKDILLML